MIWVFGFGRRSPGMWRNPGCRDALDLDRRLCTLELSRLCSRNDNSVNEGIRGIFWTREKRPDGQEPVYFIYDNVGEKH